MLDVAEAYGLSFLYPRGDQAVGASLRDHGEFARPESDLIADYLTAAKAPGTLIDVGANIGAIALPVAARCPEWRVLALEAHRGLAGVLAANAYGNRLFNVEPTHAAAGAATGLASFPSVGLAAAGNFGALSFAMARELGQEHVRMCTLDEIAPANVGFVKIDVEGFEPEVLKGASALIASRSAAWLLEANHDDRANVQANAALMRRAGYRLFWFYAPFVCAAPERGGKPTAWRGDLNILALPPGAPNLWDLAEVGADDAPWPGHVHGFPYLRRYGYAIPGA
jgi:FkbM family methyltransferase